MTSSIRIGNAAGYWGDNLDAPRRLAEAGRLDYLTLEYLAELTLSILAHQRSRNPEAGYVADFLTVLESLIPALKAQPGLSIVTNGGGMNPRACARDSAKRLTDAGLGDSKIAAVAGDDLFPSLNELVAAGEPFANLDTGEPFGDVREKIASANAYLGAAGIVEALQAGARIVITGRVADASLTVGPAIHAFGWKWDDWPRLAAATVAGHIIECGAQATGGMFSAWNENLSLENLGYPIAEISEAGGVCITKPEKTGGAVTPATVAEQLVYEIGNPEHYLTPDVDADFSRVELTQDGPDRVIVQRAGGRPAPPRYKVSMAYRDGYMATGTLVLCGPEAGRTARATGDLLLERLRAAGVTFARSHIECLGTGDTLPGVWARPTEPLEVVLRVSVHDPSRDAVERFVREFAPMAGSGPPGVTGYTGARSKPHPVFAYWPTTIDRAHVAATVEVQRASAWV
ncbi:MAG: acyclic terpene utilization AtuA family protein [Planctomycetaceae bacterium]